MANGAKRLSGDYGIEGHVHAYDGPGPKAAFAKDATSFLRALGKTLGPEWQDKPAKLPAGVNFNPGGVAVSGDATGIFWKRGSERGVYVSIGASGMYSFCGQSRSGVSVMYRVNAKNNPYSSGHNRWSKWDASVETLAAAIVAEHARVEAQAIETDATRTLEAHGRA